MDIDGKLVSDFESEIIAEYKLKYKYYDISGSLADLIAEKSNLPLNNIGIPGVVLGDDDRGLIIQPDSIRVRLKEHGWPFSIESISDLREAFIVVFEEMGIGEVDELILFNSFIYELKGDYKDAKEYIINNWLNTGRVSGKNITNLALSYEVHSEEIKTRHTLDTILKEHGNKYIKILMSGFAEDVPVENMFDRITEINDTLIERLY
jgi:hypothetical protein